MLWGVGIDVGAWFGLRADPGEVPSVSLGVIRVFLMPGGLTGVTDCVEEDRDALFAASRELERLRVLCRTHNLCSPPPERTKSQRPDGSQDR
ncbi:hypothetical protein [Acetobacter oeni]|uniref:Uncharacterized protein n=1 Tax=Acetobacter oeni TaxID=304077 RepID=A0A511XKV2_9PROT|nr:hypothetical protein [Acetobacter oeni]MBB3883827.1 hypothetical protein [Acetobacter oeni]NHO19832.1 hypothetical protein [Acetobacter oeni]GEN63579.1 hypothetical protein AOE01nite_18030 [Acetobacter oeni]